MPPLFLLRHGETEWNLQRRMQGTLDSPLTDRGRAQAQAMGRALATALADAPMETRFLCSPLGRARETAALVGVALGLDPARWVEDARLAELSYGRWEGLTIADIDRERPDAMATWRADPEGFVPPGGETHFELRRRARSFLDEMRDGQVRVVAVGHGVSGAVVRGLHLGLDARAMFVLEKPQDAFFRLDAGGETRIEAM